MRTIRNSSRLLGAGVPAPEGVYLVPGGVPGPRGVPAQRGTPGPGGCTWSWGMCTWSRGVPSQVLPPCEQNDW